MNDDVDEPLNYEPSVFCSELHMEPPPGAVAMPPLVMVGVMEPAPLRSVETLTEDGRRRMSHQQCSAENAIAAADYLIGHALTLSPYLANSRALGSLLDALWPVLRDRAYDLIEPGNEGASRMLRSFVEREVQARLSEELASRREAARLAGEARASDLLIRLWDCACEENPAARAVALAALAGEVRPALRR